MSPASYAHPDFGYFCPSHGSRRKTWRVLAVIGLGFVAGSLVLRAGPRDDGALTIATATEAASRVETMPAAEPAPTAPVAGSRAGGIKTACAGHTWTYRNGKCIGARTARSLHAAIESPPIAAIPLGHSAPPAPAALPAPVQLETAAQPAVTLPAATTRSAAVLAATAPAATVPAAAAPVAIVATAGGPTGPSMPAAQENRQESRQENRQEGRQESRKASLGRNNGRDPDRVPGRPRDTRARNGERSARTHAAPDHGDRPPSLPTSVMRWARQLQDCVGAVRCRAGEQLLRAFLSPDI